MLAEPLSVQSVSQAVAQVATQPPTRTGTVAPSPSPCNTNSPRKHASKPSWHTLSSRLRAIRSQVYASIPQQHSHTYHCLDSHNPNHNRIQLLIHASDTQLFLNHRPLLSSDAWEPLLRRAKFAPVHPLAAAWKRALSERQRRPVPSGIVLLRSICIKHHDMENTRAIAVVFSIRATVFCAYVDLSLGCSIPAAVPLAAVHVAGALDVKVFLDGCNQPNTTGLTVVWIDATRNGGQLCSFDMSLPDTTPPLSSRHVLPDSSAYSPSHSRSASSLSSSPSPSSSLWPSWLRPASAPSGPPQPASASPSSTVIDSPSVNVLTDIPYPPVAIPDYVSSEEFSRFTGYWPSPHGHFLLYTTLDTAHVPLVHVGPDASVRYPRAGSPNVRTHLHLLHMPTGRSVALCALDTELNEWGAEYVTRAGWVEEGMVWVQVCTRDQRMMAVFVVPVQAYGIAGRVGKVWEENGVDGKWISIHSTLAFLTCESSTSTNPIRLVIASEQSGFMDLYLSSLNYNPTQNPRSPTVTRLTHGPPFTLYRAEPLAIFPLSPSNTTTHHRVFFHVCRLNASGLVESALCSLDIDRNQSASNFDISTWTPPGLDAHLIALSPTAIILSTSSIDHPPSVTHIQTNLLDPTPSIPSSHVLATLAPPSPSPASLIPPTPLRPRLHTFPAHPRFPLSAFAWLPATPPPSPAGYPTVLHVYAGPDVAAVANDWYAARGGGAIVRMAALVELGFAVVVVDGRGSMHAERGVDWEAGLVRPREGRVRVKVGRGGGQQGIAHDEGEGGYRPPTGAVRVGGGGPRSDQVVVEPGNCANDGQDQQEGGNDEYMEVDTVLGDGELADQLDALDLLVTEADVPLDLARVAMVGWSYGGYLSLMGLAKHSTRVKMVVAGAPVTCWTQYDTAYSERFLGIPAAPDDDSDDARRVRAQFQASSVLAHVHGFPKEPNRLFLVHGQLDDNVHKSHHLDPLIDALVKAGVPHSVQLYPHEKHGLRQVHTIEHFETQLLWWLTQYL